MRWNAWTRIVLTQFDDEARPRPRALRCCAAAIRRGDPARVRVGEYEVDAVIVGIECSVVLLRRAEVREGRGDEEPRQLRGSADPAVRR